MSICAAPVLFESSDAPAVDGELFDVLERRYYAALHHFRGNKKQRSAIDWEEPSGSVAVKSASSGGWFMAECARRVIHGTQPGGMMR
jgi:hypothetical protein